MTDVTISADDLDVLAVVGRNVRRLREALCLSQTDLALRIAVARSSIANLEAGRQNIGLSLLAAIAASLGAKPADLLGDETPFLDAYAQGWRDGSGHATTLVRAALAHATDIAPERTTP